MGLFKEHDIKSIPDNMEKYISFRLGHLRFIDSFQFMSQSLEKLTENVAQKVHNMCTVKGLTFL